MQNRSLTQRPEHFTLNPYSSLNEGLVFAGLGNAPGSTQYRDSGGYNDGTLTNMDPPTDWVWSAELNRWALDFDGVGDGVELNGASTLLGSASEFTVHLFLKVASFIGTDYILDSTDGGIGLMLRTNVSGQLYFLLFRSGGMAIAHADFSSHYGEWASVTAVMSTSDTILYFNGNIIDQGSGIVGNLVTSSVMRLGTNFVGASGMAMSASDFIIYNRALSTIEIQQLADPSNVMLSGLILPPKRRIFTTTAGPAFKPFWARHSNNLIGAGI